MLERLKRMFLPLMAVGLLVITGTCVYDFCDLGIQISGTNTKITAYAYYTLNEEDRELYNRIVSGYEDFKPFIKVYDYETEKVKRFIDHINNDTIGVDPVGNLRAFTYKDIMYCPGYVLTKEEYEKKSEELENKVEEILTNLKIKGEEKEKLSNTDIAQRIQNYIVENCEYKSHSEEKVLNSEYDYVLDSYGALVKGEANCQGYAKAFALLMQESGITAAVISGYTTEEEQAETYHSWNMAYLDNKWVMFDTCWDDGGDFTFYHYFNKPVNFTKRSVVNFIDLPYQEGYAKANIPPSKEVQK